jgi:tRNA modification GTPase
MKAPEGAFFIPRMIKKSNTIVALATAIGTGSIAVVRVSGKDSISMVNKVFFGKNLEKVQGNTIHFGRLKDNDNEIDQVLVSVFKLPNSYTGEDSIEISCHSNHFIVEDIISLLLNNGARIADPGEFTLRAYLNHKIDLSQAEAIANIISSKSRLATRNSILQIEGALSKKVNLIKKNLIDLISFMELDLDFSEEELEIIPRAEIRKRMEEIYIHIEQMLNSFNKAKYLSGALEIAIIGKPNAGKSELLNVLLGEERAIVTNIPGTTRDTIEENLTLKNMLLKISDTAGIRFSKNHIETKGIQRTWNRVERADIILWVVDISKSINKQDMDIYNTLKNNYSKDIIIVGNKIDLGFKNESMNQIKSFNLPTVNISAKTGHGIEKLKEMIAKTISLKHEHLGEEIIVTSTRQIESLKNTHNSILEAKKSLESGAGNEFIVVELRNALNELGLITGETATEDILNNIFSGFCVGK